MRRGGSPRCPLRCSDRTQGRRQVAQTSSRVVEVSSPVARSVWREVLHADPGATALQTPEYFDAVLIATGGRDVSRLYVLRDGRPLVLPPVRRRRAAGLHLDSGFPR